MQYDVNKIRKDFPVLNQKVYNKPLIYLDNGATTQKPLPVIECVNQYHRLKNSNIHRGVHFLSDQATEEYENARIKIADFINAPKSENIIFTSGTTGSINALAFSFCERYLSKGDEIIVSEMEHHSNIVPWQMACRRKEASLKVIPFDDSGTPETGELSLLITERTKLIAVTHTSNALGSVNPVKEIIDTAHKHGIPVLIDGAQSVQHEKTDVRKMDCDFFVFSGHKIYGPTGIGVLYGKEKWLQEIPPFQGGGEMVDTVSFEHTTFREPPIKFEAGTPNYIGAIGLGEAVNYVTSVGIENIANHEKDLLEYGTARLNELDYIKIYGTSPSKTSILSFTIHGINHYDAGMIIDKMGIAVRTGSHCAQPVMQHYGIEGTVRASFALYNTRDEIDAMIEGIKKIKQML